jgi:hypothetical protein
MELYGTSIVVEKKIRIPVMIDNNEFISAFLPKIVP